jgi:hypothetical protein
MLRSGMRPEYVYAYCKTGLLITEENRQAYAVPVQAGWDAAIQEYHQLRAERCEGHEQTTQSDQTGSETNEEAAQKNGVGAACEAGVRAGADALAAPAG